MLLKHAAPVLGCKCCRYLHASGRGLPQGAGLMSVYLFMKRYAEEELYRPHPGPLPPPACPTAADYSGQFLHPDSWPPPQRGRSASEVSSDISIQLTQTPQQPPPKGGKQLPGDHHVVWAFVSSQLPASSSLLLLHLLLLPSSLPPGCHLHLTKSSPPSPPT
ncbi:hypothetical protein fugu_018584 [Takifugu bimaculatus]|uniref:Uncharacterized protein n=1 Tax=Takifugu bimaculatus TaxID=433685 RepID=A0A4Z2BMM4_9TELE|nr:hypothetical protein fugu_018584 [Takifugu bimaculatus]